MPWFFPTAAFASPIDHLDVIISVLLWVGGVVLGVYAFVHAVKQRSDAFTAVDKMTKPAWCGITGVGALLLILSIDRQGAGPVAQIAILWLVALIAVLVYLVDVRPRVVEVQQGPRW